MNMDDDWGDPYFRKAAQWEIEPTNVQKSMLLTDYMGLDYPTSYGIITLHCGRSYDPTSIEG